MTLSQTFILHASTAEIDGVRPRYTVNNVSYLNPDTPLKLADQFANVYGVYVLDSFSTNFTNPQSMGVFVASGDHKGWLELVFKNDLDVMDAWHLDGFCFLCCGVSKALLH